MYSYRHSFSGRAGYGASLEGMVHSISAFSSFTDSPSQWPYTYDTCDVGTVANQTFNGIPDVSQFPGGESKFNPPHFAFFLNVLGLIDIHHDNHFR